MDKGASRPVSSQKPIAATAVSELAGTRRSIAALLQPVPVKSLGPYPRSRGLSRLSTVCSCSPSPACSLHWKEVLESTQRLINPSHKLLQTVRNVFSRGRDRWKNPFATPVKGILLLRRNPRPCTVGRERAGVDRRKLYDKKSRKVAFLNVTRLKTPRFSDCGLPVSAWSHKCPESGVDSSFDDSTLVTSARYN